MEVGLIPPTTWFMEGYFRIQEQKNLEVDEDIKGSLMRWKNIRKVRGSQIENGFTK